MSSTETIARIADLWRYPVKSMRGERCDELHFDARGVAGDRMYAVRDADGKLGSGKDTQRLRAIDGLQDLQARLAGALPIVHFTDGRELRADDAGLAPALAAALGVDLQLAREDDVEHLDAGSVHILTHASLRWLGTALGTAAPDARRFRANLVLETAGETRVEEAWIGRRLRLGDTVELAVSARTERCAMVGFDPDGASRDPRVLRRLALSADACLGVYADVVRPGCVRQADAVQLLAHD